METKVETEPTMVDTAKLARAASERGRSGPEYQQPISLDGGHLQLAVERALVSGQLRAGDPFPSVRALSQELRINPNTAHRIVGTLVRDGLLEVRYGELSGGLLQQNCPRRWQTLARKRDRHDRRVPAECVTEERVARPIDVLE